MIENIIFLNSIDFGTLILPGILLVFILGIGLLIRFNNQLKKDIEKLNQINNFH